MNRKILVVLAVLAIALAVVAVSIEAQRGGSGRGGMGGGGGGGAEPTPTEAPPSNGGNIDNGGNIGNVGNFPPTTAPIGGYGFYIEVGQSKQWVYWGHDIAISYLSASPKQVVEVTLDGKVKLIEVELTADVSGIYWREGNFSFVLEPAVWTIYYGQPVLVSGGTLGTTVTWNTTVLYFEVIIDGSAVPPENPPGNY